MNHIFSLVDRVDPIGTASSSCLAGSQLLNCEPYAHTAGLGHWFENLIAPIEMAIFVGAGHIMAPFSGRNSD